MKSIKILTLLFITVISSNAIAQNIGDYIDVVHLKNGSKIKGIIVEQVPGKTVKIQTKDGSEYVYAEENVAKFTREEKPKEQNPLKYMDNFKRKGKGYFFEAELLQSNFSTGLRLTNGYRFNRFAKLGIALGGETLNLPYHFTGKGGYQTQRLTANLVFSGDILDKRITPFYQVELGYGFNPNFQGIQFQDNLNGPMAAAVFGVRFKTKKKIEYKLGVDLRLVQTYTHGINQPYIGIRFGIGF